MCECAQKEIENQGRVHKDSQSHDTGTDNHRQIRRKGEDIKSTS